MKERIKRLFSRKDPDPVTISPEEQEMEQQRQAEIPSLVTMDHDGVEPYLTIRKELANAVGWLPRELINVQYLETSDLLILTPANALCVRARMQGGNYQVPLRFRSAPKEYMKHKVSLNCTFFANKIIVDFEGQADG